MLKLNHKRNSLKQNTKHKVQWMATWHNKLSFHDGHNDGEKHREVLGIVRIMWNWACYKYVDSNMKDERAEGKTENFWYSFKSFYFYN